jgi:peptide deformylase
MATRNILREGEPALRQKCRVVTEFDERLRILLDDMRETLENAGGVGLAAPQVGILRRVVLVLETNGEDGGEDQLIELINPEIISSEGEENDAEGCLSVPGLFGYVIRPEKVMVRARDRFGKSFEISGEGLTARAFCHEIDHLDGLLFTRLTDRLMTPEELEQEREGKPSRRSQKRQ